MTTDAYDSLSRGLRAAIDEAWSNGFAAGQVQNKELLEARDLVLDLFAQGCRGEDGKFDHCCISSYEEAQARLIGWGMLSDHQCARPT